MSILTSNNFFKCKFTVFAVVISIYSQASEYARERGIPRLFLTANSGARIGMALSLKNKFKVCFVDEADPSKGFKYIYMDQRKYYVLL